jgi:hypothetical protein
LLTISGHRYAFAGAFRQSEMVTEQKSGETGSRGTTHGFALRPLFIVYVENGSARGFHVARSCSAGKST